MPDRWRDVPSAVGGSLWLLEEECVCAVCCDAATLVQSLLIIINYSPV